MERKINLKLYNLEAPECSRAPRRNVQTQPIEMASAYNRGMTDYARRIWAGLDRITKENPGYRAESFRPNREGVTGTVTLTKSVRSNAITNQNFGWKVDKFLVDYRMKTLKRYWKTK